MKSTILEVFEPLTLIGGGDANDDDLDTALAIAPTCVAADGGAHVALRAGVDLAAVIGDMDSISPEARARIPPERFHEIAEQDSTDFGQSAAQRSGARSRCCRLCRRPD